MINFVDKEKVMKTRKVMTDNNSQFTSFKSN